MCLVQTVEQAREQCVCGGGGDVGRRPSHSNRGFALDEPVERRSRCILAKVGRPRNAPQARRRRVRLRAVAPALRPHRDQRARAAPPPRRLPRNRRRAASSVTGGAARNVGQETLPPVRAAAAARALLRRCPIHPRSPAFRGSPRIRNRRARAFAAAQAAAPRAAAGIAPQSCAAPQTRVRRSLVRVRRRGGQDPAD